MQEPSTLLVQPVIHFHQRLRVTHTTRAWPLSWADLRPPQLNIVLTLHQLQQTISCTTPCWSTETSDLQKFVRRAPSSKSTICSQLVPAQIDPAKTRPACHHSTGSHPPSSVHHLANCPFMTTSASLNQCARHCNQVARVQRWGFCATTLMTKTIHHSQQVQTLCVAWKPRVKHLFMFGSAPDT